MSITLKFIVYVIKFYLCNLTNNVLNSYYSENGVDTHRSPKEDTSNFVNSMSPSRNIQSATNGLTVPQSPKSFVPDVCVNVSHKFSNLLPMIGYCEQCSVRVFVGMYYKISSIICCY